MKQRTHSISSAAHGTIALVFSQGCYFVLGYLAVVLLAREFGPAVYGVYGVIMSVLVWLEESGRFAIPSATAKLLAEKTSGQKELEQSAITLNLALYVALFVLLWIAAPWLASWLSIENGAFLFRVAAIDLPLFGAFTAYRGIHEGHRHFIRLGITQIGYALTKLVGVVLLLHFGVSLTSALIVNAVATLVGLAFLVPGIGVHWRWQAGYLQRLSPLLSTAVPMGLYYFALGLRTSCVLWILQLMSPSAEERMVGIFVAALNIARVPAFALISVTTVILPSISRALALKDELLAKRYISQALRFVIIVYLPVTLVFMGQPEDLMQWVYSQDFSGGGTILAVLVLGEGLRVVHAIFGAILNAAGKARKAARIAIISILPSVGLLLLLIYLAGPIGAAISSAVTLVVSLLIFGIVIWRRFGTLLSVRSVCNLALSAVIMWAIFAVLLKSGVFFLLPYLCGLIAYALALIVFREVTWQDVAMFFPKKNASQQTAT